MEQTKETRLPDRLNSVRPGSHNRLNKAANFGFRISFGGQGLLSCRACHVDVHTNSKTLAGCANLYWRVNVGNQSLYVAWFKKEAHTTHDDLHDPIT